MDSFYQLIMNYIDIWGYTAIVIAMAMESACLPVPSELVFGFAGYLVFLGHLNFAAVLLAGVAGGLAGSIVAYLVGYYGGQPFVARYGRYILLSKKHVAIAQRWFDRYGLQAVFFSRMLPVVRTFISLPAGFAGVDFVRFVVLTILGSIPWTAALIYAGMLLGENWEQIDVIGHRASLVVLAGLLVLGIYFWRKKREEYSTE
ncbi:Hypothetical protein LUCI_3555 [Lucifera butyrica]|uniref:VTT domain-containing protein n=1 Tax=Lucifera butyrica TaxID=1351585 RepID=A0A498R9S1_9FIRM|nr:DedA family protein [Lucifera butyrica]VBB08284.1 Hypothetical protein LUCI_3555 [Lucifera butyrica]